MWRILNDRLVWSRQSRLQKSANKEIDVSGVTDDDLSEQRPKFEPQEPSRRGHQQVLLILRAPCSATAILHNACDCPHNRGNLLIILLMKILGSSMGGLTH